MLYELNTQKNIPPKKATKLLATFLRDDLAEEVLGDLEEGLTALIITTLAHTRSTSEELIVISRSSAGSKRITQFLAI